MRTVLALAAALAVLPAGLAAQQGGAAAAPPAAGKVQYVGGVTVLTDDPAALAAWYEKALGLAWPIQANGGYFGGIETAAGPVRLGIMPRSAMPMARPGSSVGVVFRVSDFPVALERLKTAQVQVMEMQNEEGRFAFFADPDGNMIGIWGS